MPLAFRRVAKGWAISSNHLYHIPSYKNERSRHFMRLKEVAIRILIKLTHINLGLCKWNCAHHIKVKGHCSRTTITTTRMQTRWVINISFTVLKLHHAHLHFQPQLVEELALAMVHYLMPKEPHDSFNDLLLTRLFWHVIIMHSIFNNWKTTLQPCCWWGSLIVHWYALEWENQRWEKDLSHS